MAVLASDTFTRTVAAGGWGTSSGGQAWTASTHTFAATLYAANLSVTPSLGSITGQTGQAAGMGYLTTSYSDFDLYFEFSTSTTANTITTLFRNNSLGTTGYYVQITSGTTMKLVNSNTYVNVTSSVTISYVASTMYSLRIRAVGSSLQAKFWQTSTAEPTAWNISATDTNYTSGLIGLYASCGVAAHVDYTNVALGTLVSLADVLVATTIIKAATYTDTFNRADSSSWGTASDGNTWASGNGTSVTAFTIASTIGIAHPTVTGPFMQTLGTGSVEGDGEIVVRWKHTTTPPVPGLMLWFRANNTNTKGSVYVFINNNTVYAYYHDKATGSQTQVGASHSFGIGTMVVGSVYFAKARFVAGTLYSKCWLTTNAEPSSWDMSQALPTGNINTVGYAGLGVFGSSATNPYAAYSYTSLVVLTTLLSGGRGKFSNKASLNARVRSKDLVKATWVTKTVSKDSVKSAPVTRSVAKAAIKGPMLSQARSIDDVRTQLQDRSRVKVSIRAVGRAVAGEAFNGRAPQGAKAVARQYLRASVVTKAVDNTFVKMAARTQARGRFITRLGMLARTVQRFSTRASEGTKAVARDFIRVPMITRTVAKDSLQIPLKGRAVVKTSVRAVTTMLSRQVFKGRVSQVTRTLSKAPIHVLLFTRTVAKDSLRITLRESMAAKTSVRAVGKAVARELYKVKVTQRARAIAHSSLHVPLFIGSRSTFSLRTQVATKTRARFTSSGKLATRMLSRFLLEVAARIYQLVFCSIHKVQPADYIGSITPNTSVLSQATLESQSMVPVTALSAAVVVVSFPDDTTSTYSLANGDITSVGSGVWQFGYITKGEGVYTEVWSLITPNGAEMASFKHSFRVAY